MTDTSGDERNRQMPAGAREPGRLEPRLPPFAIVMGDEEAILFAPRPKPPRAPFGYVHRDTGVAVACTWDELVDVCIRDHAGLVWSPATERMVPPRQMPGLTAEMLRHFREDAASQRRTSVAMAAGTVLLAVVLPYAFAFVPLGAAIAAFSHWRVKRLDGCDASDVVWKPDEPPRVAFMRGR